MSLSIKDKINQDLKQAMLSGNKTLVTTLRGIKSAILYAEVEKNLRDNGLPEDDTISVLAKEAKKRQESADMYNQGGNNEKAQTELAEKTVIEQYLPPQLSEHELEEIIAETISTLGVTSMSGMGQVISAVKERAGASADGAMIAKIVKGKLSS